ncbi:MAG: DUF3299 domain-containing protein [Pseudomonadota bacterium]
MPIELTRRALVARLAAAGAAMSGAGMARADAPIELDWIDLIPPGEQGIEILNLGDLGVVQHGQLSMPEQESEFAPVVTEYNGKQVRIPGYSIPIDYAGTEIASLLLVPYIGACIHVPPPPSNQLIYVTLTEPYVSQGLWDPVFVTGELNTSSFSTDLADIGYVIDHAEVEPYS